MAKSKVKKTIFEQLPDKQKLFVTEYIGDFNQTRAATEAGYAHPQVAGAKLMTSLKVRAAIDELTAPVLNNNLLSIDSITQQLANFLFRTIKDFVDADGYLVTNVNKLPDSVAQCIESWEAEILEEWDSEAEEKVPVGQKLKVKLVSKAKMQELAMRYRNLLQPESNKTENKTIIINGVAVAPNLLWDSFFGSTPALEQQRALNG